MKNLYFLFLLTFCLTPLYSDTAFRWGAITSGPAQDIDNVNFATGEATVFTFLDFDITSAPSFQAHSSIAGAFEVHIDDIPVFLGFEDISVAPFGNPPWSTTTVFAQGNNDRVGQIASALIVDGGGLTSISIGDFLGQSSLVAIQNLGSPASGTQIMDGGSVITNIQVIPEPSTFLLMAVAGLGFVVTRRLKK